MHGEMWVPKIACHRPEAFRCLSGTAQMLNSLLRLETAIGSTFFVRFATCQTCQPSHSTKFPAVQDVHHPKHLAVAV